MKKKMLYKAIAGAFLTISLVVSSGSIVKSYAYTEVEVADGGSISGTVTFVDEMPEVKMLKVDKDVVVCNQGKIPSSAIIISGDNKGIKNAVVTIENIENGKKVNPSGENPVLDQLACIFIPHVLAVPAGVTIDILNSDDILHNVHSYAIKNAPFNDGVSGHGKLPKKFDFSEIIPIKCDLHPWMTAFIVVVSNPYFAVTDANGNYTIDNVPAGTYKLQVWQERLGKQQADVTVEAGKGAKVDFALKAKKRRRR